MTEKTICNECGLPIALCNSIASYRLAVDRFKRGQSESAQEFVAEAEQYYLDWRGTPHS